MEIKLILNGSLSNYNKLTIMIVTVKNDNSY